MERRRELFLAKIKFCSIECFNILVHIDVLILCSKFEVILTSIFRVTAILRKCQNLEKIPVL